MKVHKQTNPFIINGYVSPEYFCDREKETEALAKNIRNGRNVVLTSPRRMGKSGLVKHCVTVNNFSSEYNVFITDIYPANDLKDFTAMLGSSIVKSLKGTDEKALEFFLSIVTSVQAAIGTSICNDPMINLQLRNPLKPQNTLEEIFSYIKKSRKPSLVVIDEFQAVSKFPEANVEEMLRTYIQECPTSRFIFTGSQRHTIAQMFNSSGRAFYQSTVPMELLPIPQDRYLGFAQEMFDRYGRRLDEEAFTFAYDIGESVTWYVQMILNQMFLLTGRGETATADTAREAVSDILSSYDFTYQEMLAKIPSKQKDLLLAMARSGCPAELLSADFVMECGMTTSSIQSAKRGLLAKDYLTESMGRIKIYNRFFELWLKERC